MKKEIPIMFCFDKNYVIPASVAFLSLMEHACPDYNYIFYILHSDISEIQQQKLNETVKDYDNCKLVFKDMNHELEYFWKHSYVGDHFSKEVMYKLLTASLFPQYDKIIVSDVDVVFLGDVSSSYLDFDISCGCYIGGVKPIGKIRDYYKVYKDYWSDEEIANMSETCGGYLVMNLFKIRQDNVEHAFIESLYRNGYRLNQMEQDILNIECVGKIYHLDLNYVVCTYMYDIYKDEEDFNSDIVYSSEQIKDAMENPIQLHYATGIKPWKMVNCTKSEEWYKYIVKTPFLEEFLETLPDKMVFPDYRINQTIVNQVIQAPPVVQLPTRYQKYKNYIKNNKLFLFKPSFYKKIFSKIKGKVIPNNIQTYEEEKTEDNNLLLIFDDIFPANYSAFRYQEYDEYFKQFKNVICISTGKALSYLKIPQNFSKVVNKYVSNNCLPSQYILPNVKNLKNKELEKYDKKLAVITFLNNAIDNIKYLEKNKIDFILNLYPGGGFILNDSDSDKKLKKILSSKFLKKIIVNQQVIKDYLIDNYDYQNVLLVPGVVTPKELINIDTTSKLYYCEKEYLDICFVAYKNTPKGEDKGYDIFIEAAKKLYSKNKKIRFHVVGGFDENDIDVSSIKESISFYGVLQSEEFKDFYSDKDIIVSPTRYGYNNVGRFDGFPTAATTEAALNGLLMICTDELNQNLFFKNNEDLFIVQPDSDEIALIINKFYENASLLKKIAIRGQSVIRKEYSIEKQIGPRINEINNYFKGD